MLHRFSSLVRLLSVALAFSAATAVPQPLWAEGAAPPLPDAHQLCLIGPSQSVTDGPDCAALAAEPTLSMTACDLTLHLASGKDIKFTDQSFDKCKADKSRTFDLHHYISAFKSAQGFAAFVRTDGSDTSVLRVSLKTGEINVFPAATVFPFSPDRQHVVYSLKSRDGLGGLAIADLAQEPVGGKMRPANAPILAQSSCYNPVWDGSDSFTAKCGPANPFAGDAKYKSYTLVESRKSGHWVEELKDAQSFDAAWPMALPDIDQDGKGLMVCPFAPHGSTPECHNSLTADRIKDGPCGKQVLDASGKPLPPMVATTPCNNAPPSLLVADVPHQRAIFRSADGVDIYSLLDGYKITHIAGDLQDVSSDGRLLVMAGNGVGTTRIIDLNSVSINVSGELDLPSEISSSACRLATDFLPSDVELYCQPSGTSGFHFGGKRWRVTWRDQAWRIADASAQPIWCRPNSHCVDLASDVVRSTPCLNVFRAANGHLVTLIDRGTTGKNNETCDPMPYFEDSYARHEMAYFEKDKSKIFYFGYYYEESSLDVLDLNSGKFIDGNSEGYAMTSDSRFLLNPPGEVSPGYIFDTKSASSAPIDETLWDFSCYDGILSPPADATRLFAPCEFHLLYGGGVTSNGPAILNADTAGVWHGSRPSPEVAKPEGDRRFVACEGLDDEFVKTGAEWNFAKLAADCLKNSSISFLANRNRSQTFTALNGVAVTIDDLTRPGDAGKNTLDTSYVEGYAAGGAYILLSHYTPFQTATFAISTGTGEVSPFRGAPQIADHDGLALDCAMAEKGPEKPAENGSMPQTWPVKTAEIYRAGLTIRSINSEGMKTLFEYGNDAACTFARWTGPNSIEAKIHPTAATPEGYDPAHIVPVTITRDATGQWTATTGAAVASE